MNKNILNKYFEFLSEIGHRNTHAFLGINLLEFGVLSEMYSDIEVIAEISKADNGVFLFKDNKDFTIRTLDLLSQYIENQTEIYSDLFDSDIKIYSLSIDNQSYIILIEVRMSLILKIF